MSLSRLTFGWQFAKLDCVCTAFAFFSTSLLFIAAGVERKLERNMAAAATRWHL